MIFAAALVLGQGSITTDPRLMERVRFDSTLEPIAQFVDRARGASGSPLSVDPSLEYLKVDAFVDDQPLGKTLSKLAEVFDLEWQASGDGYKLVPNKEALVRENAYLVDEENQINKVVEQEIAVYREINQLVPKSDKPWPRRVNRFEGWIPRRDAALDELDRAKENNDSADKITSLQVRYDALKQISDGKPNLQIARLIGQLTPHEITDFRRGIPFFASNEIKARLHYSLGDIKPNNDLPLSSAIRSVVIAKVDPDSHRINYKEMTFLGNQTAMAAEPAQHYPFDEIAPSLRKLPFAVALKAWDQTDEMEKLLETPYAPSQDEIAGGISPWYGKRNRLGDHLRWLHRVTNLPIIAQADRVAHPFIRSYRLARTSGEYVSKLMKACKGYSRKSDDFLLVRDGVYWHKSAQEIPEHVLAKMEHPGGKLNFTTIGDFATQLSHAQAMLLEDSNGFVVQFPRFRFSEAHPAVKLLSSLSSEQIMIAGSKNGLPYLALSDQQMQLYSSAVVEGIYGRGFISDNLLNNLIFNGFKPVFLQSMRFCLHQTNMSSVYTSEEITEEGIPIELVPKRSYPNRDTMNFEFAYHDSHMKFMTENLGI